MLTEKEEPDSRVKVLNSSCPAVSTSLRICDESSSGTSEAMERPMEPDMDMPSICAARWFKTTTSASLFSFIMPLKEKLRSILSSEVFLRSRSAAKATFEASRRA